MNEPNDTDTGAAEGWSAPPCSLVENSEPNGAAYFLYAGLVLAAAVHKKHLMWIRAGDMSDERTGIWCIQGVAKVEYCNVPLMIEGLAEEVSDILRPVLLGQVSDVRDDLDLDPSGPKPSLEIPELVQRWASELDGMILQ